MTSQTYPIRMNEQQPLISADEASRRFSYGGAILLVMLTLSVYAVTFRNDFVNFDDDRYVTQNPSVRQGLTPSSIAYAFTTFDTGNWIPLTWLSLELNATLFGIHPAGFQATNILLHALNGVLVFQLMLVCGFLRGTSLLIAGLFAVHPLHVESVAWISERKDVLSTFFYLAAILLYFRYVRSPGWGRWLAVLGCDLLGLMSKPMLVTLPLILLLLNFWPLRRLSGARPVEIRDAQPKTGGGGILLEQLPLLALSIVFGLLTIVAQASEETFVTISSQPLSDRVGQTVVSLAWYCWKTCWPVSLSPFYPLPYERIDGLRLGLAILFLTTITLWAVRNRRESPWQLTGWIWFLVTILPVAGLLQVGGQAYADRYSYVPQLGLFLMVIPTAAQSLRSLHVSLNHRRILAVALLVPLAMLTVRQISFWRSSSRLWEHALSVDPTNWMAHFQLGREALMDGKLETALTHAKLAVEFHSQSATVWALVGRIAQERGDWHQAEIDYRQALQHDPDNREGTIGMAAVAHAHGQYLNAADFLTARLEHHPRDRYARIQLGLLYAEMERFEPALMQFEEVLKQDPSDAMTLISAGRITAQAGDDRAAIGYFQRALRVVPDDAGVHAQLAQLLRRAGDFSAAETHAAEARRLGANRQRAQWN